MKLKNYAVLFIIPVILFACKKDPVTIPVYFTSTTYQTLGTFDSVGTPSYLLGRDAISSGMQDLIGNTLVEKSDLRMSHPELLNNPAIADISITSTSDVFVTFVFQLTNSRNALAFYTYPTNSSPGSPADIKIITYIFPSVGYGTKLKAGDKVKIGRFDPGTSIGFVLLKDAWVPSTRSLDNSAVHFCSNDILNPEVSPELKKHAVLFDYTPENKVLIGFENTDRTVETCDHDFNDVVIYVTITP